MIPSNLDPFHNLLYESVSAGSVIVVSATGASRVVNYSKIDEEKAKLGFPEPLIDILSTVSAWVDTSYGTPSRDRNVVAEALLLRLGHVNLSSDMALTGGAIYGDAILVRFDLMGLNDNMVRSLLTMMAVPLEHIGTATIPNTLKPFKTVSPQATF